MRVKLTEKAIGQLKAPDPSGRQRLHWDSELPGFGVLCSGKTDTKSYVVQKDLPNSGPTRRVTVANVNAIPLKEAREIAGSVIAKLGQGIDPKAKKPKDWTLREALENYVRGRKDLRPASIKSYRRSIEVYVVDWADKPLRSVTRDMVLDRLGKLGEEKGAATANTTMRTLRVLWNDAAEHLPDLPPNPVRLRKQWFPVARRSRMVKLEDLPRFYVAVNELPNPVARDYLLLLLFTGLRRTEAATLRWDDIDFVGKVIRIPGQRTKSGSKLDLPMTDLVFNLLMRRKAPGLEKYVFSSDSKAGHIAEPKFPLKLVAEKCGIQISAHDLRRTFITVAESTDISPLALKGLVNHSLGNDVTSGYVQMTAERLRKPAQLVADHFKVLCGIEPAGDNVVPLHQG